MFGSLSVALFSPLSLIKLPECDLNQVDTFVLFTSTNSPDNSLSLFPSIPQSSWVTLRNMTHLTPP